jgi:hypothetical protein
MISGRQGRSLQALGGDCDRTGAREQMPPSAPSKSVGCRRLTGWQRIEVKGLELDPPGPLTPPCPARSPVLPPTDDGEARGQRRDRLGCVVHESSWRRDRISAPYKVTRHVRHE